MEKMDKDQDFPKIKHVLTNRVIYTSLTKLQNCKGFVLTQMASLRLNYLIKTS